MKSSRLTVNNSGLGQPNIRQIQTHEDAPEEVSIKSTSNNHSSKSPRDTGRNSPIIFVDKKEGTDEGISYNLNPSLLLGYSSSNYKFKNFQQI